jgi:hypothetical protein
MTNGSTLETPRQPQRDTGESSGDEARLTPPPERASSPQSAHRRTSPATPHSGRTGTPLSAQKGSPVRQSQDKRPLIHRPKFLIACIAFFVLLSLVGVQIYDRS